MSESDSETRGDKSQPAKKKPAKPGQVLDSKPLPAGSAETAAAKGGAVKPIDSALLGDGAGQPPAASLKTSPAGAAGMVTPTGSTSVSAPADAKPASPTDSASRTPSVAKPTEKPVEKPADKIADKITDKPADTLAEPARRDGPASTETRPASVASAAPVTKVERTGFWPVALGGVVAAGLGAAATLWALPHLPESWRGTASAPVDLDALRAEAAAAAKAEIAAQGEAIAAAAKDSATTAGAEAGRASGSEAALAAIEERLAALTVAAPEPVTAAAETPPPPLPADVLDGSADPRLAEMQAQIEAQAQQIAELAARPALDPAVGEEFRALADRAAALQQQISSAAEAAQQSITAAQAEAQKLQEAAAESTRRAEAVAAVAALQTALDQGVSTEEAVDGLKAAGVQPPEAVNAGVPVLADLQASFDAAARAALQAALRADSPDEGAVGIIGNFLRAQTGARSVTPREGADPDAILSRAGAAVQAGDIAAALTEIAALPAAARTAAPMAEWIAGAEAYAGARAALGELSGATN